MARHLFLTGDKGVGKSTVLRALLAREGARTVGGFYTVKQGGGVYLLRPGTDDAPSPDTLLFRCGEAADPARFDALGCRALCAPCELLVMDELGPHEAAAGAFQAAVLHALDGNVPILGVLQRAEGDFLRRVAAHPQVRVVEVTAENRNPLARTLYLTDTVNSYGAIVFGSDGQHGFVLMVRSLHGWSFPKGHPEAGESPAETARREILEETAIAVAIDSGFARTVPSIRPGDSRSVTFFMGYGDSAHTPAAHEVPDAAWIPVEEAAARIVFPGDRAAFLDALAHWQTHEKSS